MSLAPKLVVVTRKSALEELVIRFGTRDRARFYIERSSGDYAEYEAAHTTYQSARTTLKSAIPQGVRTQWIDRLFLPTFVFGPQDLVLTLGQDGLVVNVAKYLDHQPVIAINPDPHRIDGVLLPFTLSQAGQALVRVLSGSPVCESVTMAQVELNDGQRLLAVNDLFLGPRSHGSARYRISHGGTSEIQCSSGVIVSTGAGSTGWFRSILAGAAGVVEGFEQTERHRILRESFRFPWDSRRLAFSVREPFTSRTSAATLVFGWIESQTEFILESLMPNHGVIFSDGFEDDALQFNSGSVARIHIADRVLRLVRPG